MAHPSMLGYLPAFSCGELKWFAQSMLLFFDINICYFLSDVSPWLELQCQTQVPAFEFRCNERAFMKLHNSAYGDVFHACSIMQAFSSKKSSVGMVFLLCASAQPTFNATCRI